ncbi:hypothetical protein B1B04_19610 [Lysinibacillus sp. KCTC 33748]|uniref:hypothetical protein n=1 Tax=unclassified Lysinibacillus TaxID=2636778 RepID=UPI0009A6505A|nr:MULTISPECIES: hypothetical protein [unclassified Lysinibacillus]OXS68676.1 hypothetical protein B1B04_19610 [Lysinibacillus sp. KCTC 33748]SKC07745.1 hypothetical protein SAMN06295926_1216 [Lysinibacillus sp. AC-3]
MLANSKHKKIIIVVTITFFLISGFFSYLFISSKIERKKEEREYAFEMKKSIYSNYKESMDEIDVAKNVETVIRVIEESEDVLNKLSDDKELVRYYSEFEEGNDYIDTLRELAIKNLNLAVPALLESYITLSQYESIDFIEESEHISEENKSILLKIMARVETEETKQYLDRMEKMVKKGRYGAAISLYKEKELIQHSEDGNALYYYALLKQNNYGYESFEAKEELAQNVNPNYTGRMSAEINEEFEYKEGVVGIFHNMWGYYYEENQKSDIYIGMRKEEVLESKWGKPKDVNRTTTSNSINEQWVYDNYKYLYFEDGILTTIQE